MVWNSFHACFLWKFVLQELFHKNGSLSSLKQKYYPIPPTDSSGAAEMLQQQNSCCCNLLSKVCPNFNDIVYATWQHVAILWENLFLFWNTYYPKHCVFSKSIWDSLKISCLLFTTSPKNGQKWPQMTSNQKIIEQRPQLKFNFTY